MYALPLVVLLTLAGSSASRPIPAGCQEDHGICREDCTIEYGGSTKKYRQLGECLLRCDQAVSACSNRYHSLQGTGLAPPPERQPDPRPAAPEPSREAEASGDTSTQPPTQPSDAVRQEAPEPEPTEQPTEEEEPPPPPKPAPKPTTYEAPPLPPEPEEDISEWDPDGD